MVAFTSWSNRHNENAVASGIKICWYDCQRHGFKIIARMKIDSNAIADGDDIDSFFDTLSLSGF